MLKDLRRLSRSIRLFSFFVVFFNKIELKLINGAGFGVVAGDPCSGTPPPADPYPGAAPETLPRSAASQTHAQEPLWTPAQEPS